MKPPQDINCLLLQKYKDNNILILCAREGMINRINKVVKNILLSKNNITIAGIWGIKDIKLIRNDNIFDYDLLSTYNPIFICGKSRIDSNMYPIYELIENFCLVN